MPNVEVANLGQESKNVFTELFGNDVSQKGSGMMNAVAASQEKKTSFFGSKPKEDEGLTLKKLREHPSRPGAAALKACFLLLLLVGGASLSQNSSTFSFFGTNPALHKEQVQEQVNELQAEVNVQDHLAAVLLLDQFSGKADEYFYNLAQAESEYSSENKKSGYEEKVDELKPELITLLAKVQQHFSSSMDETALAEAQATLDLLSTDLHAKTGTVDEITLLQDLQDLETTKLLLTQTSFKDLVNGINLAEVSDEDFEGVYDAFSTINASVTATITKIKAGRISWSEYLDSIEELTKDVDPLFNTEFTGTLSLSDIRFNSDGTVTVSGASLTQDTKNFTLLAELIDTYEEAEDFENVEERTYSKSGDDEAYTGNFRIDLTLEP